MFLLLLEFIQNHPQDITFALLPFQLLDHSCQYALSHYQSYLLGCSYYLAST